MHPCQDDMLNYVSTHRLLSTIADTEALGPTFALGKEVGKPERGQKSSSAKKFPL